MEIMPNKFIEIMMTQKCNMNCKYCFGHDKNSKDLPKEAIEKIKKNPNIFQLRFLGGEPLLNLDAIEEICDSIKNSTELDSLTKEKIIKRSSITTNGTLIPKYIDRIKKLGLFITVSLDGTKESNDIDRVYKDGTGSWDDVMKGISLLKENNIPYIIAITLTKNKFPYLFDTFKMLIDNNLSISNSCNIVTNQDYTDEDIDIFISQQEKIYNYVKNLDNSEEILKNWFYKAIEPNWKCDAALRRLNMNEDGTMSPCVSIGLNKNREFYSSVKGFNLYIHYNNQGICFSKLKNKSKQETTHWFKACPSHNIDASGSLYYQDCRYNLLVTEFYRFLDSLKNAYENKTEIVFKRENFVKDLYNSKELNKFNIEFTSLLAFFNYIEKGFYEDSSRDIIIKVDSKKEIEILKEAVKTLYIHNKIILRSDDLDDAFETISSYESSISHKNTQEKFKNHWIDFTLTANNYEKTIENIAKLLIQDNRFRYIDLKIDYKSFEKKSIEELHNLYFQMNRLSMWKSMIDLDHEGIVLRKSETPLRCKIDEELNLFIGSEKIMNIQRPELNKIRSLLDIDFPDSKIKNKYFIDLEQNKIIMGDYYRIPYLAEIIVPWLENDV